MCRIVESLQPSPVDANYKGAESIAKLDPERDPSGNYSTAMGTSAAKRVDLQNRICVVRGLSVLLDADLAALYGVKPGALLQAIRRNASRFPADFMFQLTNQEVTNLLLTPDVRTMYVLSFTRRWPACRLKAPGARKTDSKCA